MQLPIVDGSGRAHCFLITLFVCIIKKLQNSSDDEIRTMAEVRDPETDPKYIEKILKREFRKALRVEEIYSNKPTTIEKEIIISDILEAGIKNPALILKESFETFFIISTGEFLNTAAHRKKRQSNDDATTNSQLKMLNL